MAANQYLLSFLILSCLFSPVVAEIKGLTRKSDRFLTEGDVISTGYCQPYQASSTSNGCSCAFTLCPQELVSIDNCDISCTSSSSSITMKGIAKVQLFISENNNLLTAGKASAASLSCATTDRQQCTTIENYQLPSSTYSSCQNVILRESCASNATCVSMFRVRIMRSAGSVTSTKLPNSNITAWSSVRSSSSSSSLSLTNTVSGSSCQLLSYSSSTTTTTSSNSNMTSRSSTVLIIVLLFVGFFVTCSIYRHRQQRKQQLNEIHPQNSIHSTNKTWWFFKSNIIKPLLPVTVQQTTTSPSQSSPSPEQQHQQQNQRNNPIQQSTSVRRNNNISEDGNVSSNNGTRNNRNVHQGSLPLAVSADAIGDSVVPFDHDGEGDNVEIRGAEVPVAVLLNPFTAPQTPPQPRTVDHARLYRSVILVPELGSPAIAVPATPSPWSPNY